MSRIFHALWVCGISAVLMTLADPSTLWAESANRIVAIVADDVITLHELNKKIKELTGFEAEEIRSRDPQKHEEIRRTILDRLIEERIAMEKIRERNIQVTDKEVLEAIERSKKNNHWTDDELMEMLRSKGLTYDDYRLSIKRDIQRSTLINFEVRSRIIVRDEQIEAYYEEHRDLFQREGGIELATIFLLQNNPERPSEMKDVQAIAERVLNAIKNGQDFGELARQYSDGPGAQEGGYLGRFEPGQLEPEVRKVVEETPEGGVGDLIIRPNGIQIIKVLSKFEGGVLPLEKVRDAIYGILFREEIDRRYTTWIQELKEKTYTKILL